jgi:Ca2+-binding RTX toxin-like protein
MSFTRLLAAFAGTCLLAVNLTGSVAQATTSTTCFGKSPTITGTTGNDVINGTSHADVIIGKDGADIIHGNGGDDLICGSDGVDTLYGDAGNDKLSGDNHQDILSGGSGADIINGGGQYYADVAGGDTVSYALSSTGVNVNLVTGKGGPVGQAQDTITGVMTIIGSPYNDTLTASADAHGNKIVGGAGADTITGNDGLDMGDDLSGGSGNDTINANDGFDDVTGGPGSDVLNGGGDSTGYGDTIHYENDTAPVNVNLATGHATGEGTDTISGFSRVVGSTFDDVITGDANPNSIQAEDGSDTVYGGGGDDELLGDGYACGATLSTPTCSDGGDTIHGGAGNDTIYDGTNYPYGTPGPDVDTLFGGSGSDTVTATLGDDTLNVRDGVSGNDSADGGDGTDTCSADSGDSVINCP